MKEQGSGYLLGQVLGKDKPSEVAEYYVQHITDKGIRIQFIATRALYADVK